MNNCAYKEAMGYEDIDEEYDMTASEILGIAAESNGVCEGIMAGFTLGYKRGVQASKHIIEQQGEDRIRLERILDSLSPKEMRLVYIFAAGRIGHIS